MSSKGVIEGSCQGSVPQAKISSILSPPSPLSPSSRPEQARGDLTPSTASKKCRLRRRFNIDLDAQCSCPICGKRSIGDERDLPRTEWSDNDFDEVVPLKGHGGDVVHQVKHRFTGRLMACKTISIPKTPMKQLVRELNISTNISHPNIIHFLGYYMNPSSNEVKLIMELCEGKSLEAVMMRIEELRTRISEKVVGKFAEGILQGLAYLHSEKLIHRDIKPSNILLSGEGVVKLSNFAASGELVNSLANTVTQTCTILYAAPELLIGAQYSIRADVWSTGISLLEVAQGRFPLPVDTSVLEFAQHIVNEEPPQLEDEAGVRWSDAMKNFFKQTLQVDPELRPTPKEMLLHPWIVRIMKQEIPMDKWIRQLWGWPETN
ncbi:kinase-like domain-containing protein, partial [Russula brevipes]